MNWERTGQVLQIVSNVGVVIGLVLVALQMSQTTEAVRASRLDAWNMGAADTELTLMGDHGATAIATAMTRPSDLTEEQFLQLVWYQDSLIARTLAAWQAHRAGQISADDWAYIKTGFPIQFGFPAARELWKSFKFGLPNELVTELDEEIQRHPELEFSATLSTALPAIHRIGDSGSLVDQKASIGAQVAP